MIRWLILSALAASPTLYEELHQAPELSLQETQTAKRLAAELRALGLEVTEGVGGTGVVGVLKNGAGPVGMLRTDTDALPVTEETGLKYASRKKGVMHACGHDAHMAVWVEIAKRMAAEKDKWSGTLLFVGQPAEEKGAGAKAMLADGLFKRFPKPSFALAWHVDPLLTTGSIGYRAGYLMATADSVDITMIGKGGHGALPHAAINPVVLASKVVVELQAIASQEIAATEPVVVTVGAFHGGTKSNVIADKATLEITVRTFTPSVRERVLESIRRKAKAIAAAAGAPEPQLKISEDPTPSLYNDPALVEKLLPVFRKALGEDRVVQVDPAPTAEDFSRYWLIGKVPSAMFRLGTTKKGAKAQSLHSSTYYPDVAALPVGVSAMTEALQFLLKK
jgi:amidohydrolase